MTKQIIYVEGPDCAGKSTLVEAIKKDNDLIIHNGRYETAEAAYASYLNQLSEFGNSKFDRLILDRGVLSEVIYGMVMRNETPDEHSFRLIIKQLEEFDYHIVVCLPPFGPTVIKWAQRQTQEYVNQFEQYVLVYDLYSKVQSELGEHVIVHDYTKNHKEVVDALSR